MKNLINGLIRTASWALGAVFLVSGASHWDNPYFFLGSVYSYKIVGPETGKLIAVFLPVFELILSACLFFNLFEFATNVLSSVLLGSFVLVQSWAYYSGLDISCGCFGPNHSMRIGAGSIATTSIMLLLSFAPLIQRIYQKHPLGQAKFA